MKNKIVFHITTIVITFMVYELWLIYSVMVAITSQNRKPTRIGNFISNHITPIQSTICANILPYSHHFTLLQYYYYTKTPSLRQLTRLFLRPENCHFYAQSFIPNIYYQTAPIGYPSIIKSLSPCFRWFNVWIARRIAIQSAYK